MLPPIHFFKRPHMTMWGGPMMMPWMNPWDRMMIKMAQPLLIGGMISNFGQTIADIISGRRTNSGAQCNCANSNMFSYGLYNNYYDNTMTSGFYPYVNLNNAKPDEGKGGTNNSASTIAEMKAAYKNHGIESIYKGDDGRYIAVTKDGTQLTALNLGDLTDEIGEYISAQKAVVQQNDVKNVDEDNSDSENSNKTNTNENVTNKAVTDKPKQKNPATKPEDTKPIKYTDETNIRYAVDKLHRGIKGDGLATVTPDHITDVLFDKKVFNKDSAVSILNAYAQKYGHPLWVDIEAETFYKRTSKLEDYQKIMEVCLERAKETVTNKEDLKKIQDFYNTLHGDKLKQIVDDGMLGSVIEDTIYYSEFGKIMKIISDAEPK